MSEDLNKELAALLSEIRLGNVRNYDPVRFAFIESSANRLEQSQHKNNPHLIATVHKAVQQYIDAYSAHKEKAKRVVAQIKSDKPQQHAQAQTFFSESQFQKLDQFSAQLSQRVSREEIRSGLGGLLSLIGQGAVVEDEQSKSPSFDELLDQQEQALRIAAGDVVEVKQHNNVPELNSMKVFRESMKYFTIDKTIDRAINDFPENAGPHNPQMLAIKSLTHMKDLSPQYLRRFASYIETILWLDKNTSKLLSIKLANSKK